MKVKKTILKIRFNTLLRSEDIECLREAIEEELGVEILSIDEV